MSTFRKRRREHYEDKRPHWSDPNLYVTRQTSSGKVIEITAEKENIRATYSLVVGPVPDWRNDPTYNLRRKR